MIKMDRSAVILLVTASLAAGGGYWAWQKYHPAEAKAEAMPPATRTVSDTIHFDANAPQLAFLQIMPVEAYPEPLVEPLNARLVYDDNHTARVFSPIAGRVTHISAEAGQSVQAGEALLQLDSPDYAQAAADAAKADADLLRKRQAFARAKLMFESQAMARRDLESAEADYLQAEAEAQRASARLKNLAGKSVGTDGQFTLHAPISGIISERQVNAGSEVRPDAPIPLFVITSPQHLWAVVDLPERQLGKVRIGQPVSVEVDAYPDQTFTGTVAVIGMALDPLTRRIQVRCALDNAGLKLKPEMFARVIPVTDNEAKLPRIPNTALFTQGVASFIFVELSPGQLQRRRVELAMQGQEYSYVRTGLQAGERVVTTGALLLNSELSGEN